MRRLTKPGTLLLVTVIVVVASAATALAATIHSPSTGNWSVIGTPAADTIDQTTSTATANDTILGLGGNDSITVGNGNNIIEADGSCPPGDQKTVTPFPGNAAYCSIDQISSSHTDTIKAGNGTDLILGGGYKNTITAGNGTDLVYAGGANSNSVTVGNGSDLVIGGAGPNTITAGNGNDLIWAGSSGDTINVGTGSSFIYAINKKVDHITCAAGNRAIVYADKNDVVKGCRTVITSGSDPAPPPFGSVVQPAVRLHAAQTRYARSHHKAKRHSSKRH
jgi:Ca2+-binding RTX toxin-like protein